LCGSIDASLVCADDLFGDGVDLCLPYGGFPGGPCADGSACGDGMVCRGERCLYDCTNGGDTVCTNVRSTLTCAADVYDVPVCLPKGSFPGGPCGEGSSCAPLQQGAQSLPTTCKNDTCLLTCDNMAGGDALCAAVDASLVCADNLYGDGVDLCLPRGAFPGGPCGAGNSCASDLNGVAAVDMRCQSGVCVVDCDNTATLQKGDGLCEAVNPALTCVDSAALPFCSVKCGPSNACAAGTSCLVSQGACLPTGSFLGSPCASGACNPSAVPMLACANNTCAARCNTGGGMGNSYCAALNVGLSTCQMVAAGLEVCVP
jgi:hypothetical protein